MSKGKVNSTQEEILLCCGDKMGYARDLNEYVCLKCGESKPSNRGNVAKSTEKTTEKSTKKGLMGDKRGVRYGFLFLDNSVKIRGNNFNKLMRKLNKPLFSIEDLE